MYVVLDCEWNRPQKRSQFKQNKKGYVLRNELMQIGAVRLNDSFEIVDTFNSNIKPIVYKIIHPEVQRLTHIKRSELISAPYFPAVWSEFETFLHPDDIIITWGTADEKVILNNVYYWGVPHSELRVMDLQAIVENIFFEDKQNKSLQYVLDYLELDQCPQGHVAINDAIDTASVFRYVSNLEEVSR